MTKKTILGIFRERSHSPQREFDDEAILKETAKGLCSRLGLEIPLLHPEEFLETGLDVKPDLIFFMCEEEPCLNKLRHIQETMGCTLVNTVRAVENTFRQRMLEILSREDFFPESQIVCTMDAVLEDIYGEVWIKRGDFHAIEEDDVVFARDKDHVRTALERFSGRGIKNVVIQKHVPGDIIKFYSVTGLEDDREYWFKWFYHKDQDLNGYEFSKDELLNKCLRAGRLMELEIYGGDAIVRPDGRIYVIDVNAWPSFALFRKEAAEAICSLIEDRLFARGSAFSQERASQEAGVFSPTP